jgi:phospholipid/cholesterol/gamma-HCH transport system ATP-binding protein
MSAIHEDAVLIAKDVAAGYPGRLILKGVTVAIHRGKITCIIGGSGCGKSTFLRTTVGLLEPARGEVWLLGKRLQDLAEDDRASHLSRVGLMFQYGALLNSLTIAENLSIPLRAHTQLAPEVIAEATVLKAGLVHLTHALDLLPGELSGGMRKRAGLARALMLDPEVVMCDEPSAGLDPLTAADLDNLILQLRDLLGITVVVVTHELSSIRAIADRIVMLDQGLVHFDGTLDEALASEDSKLMAFFGREAADLPRKGITLLEALQGGTP